jgi:hypothetical protein
MIKLVEPTNTTTLDDYSAYPHLASAVQDLREKAADVRRHINGRSILMVNSTAQICDRDESLLQ